LSADEGREGGEAKTGKERIVVFSRQKKERRKRSDPYPSGKKKRGEEEEGNQNRAAGGEGQKDEKGKGSRKGERKTGWTVTRVLWSPNAD